MLKCFASICLLLMLATVAMAQFGTIRGRVITADGQAVENVTIRLEGTGRLTIVNAEGTYQLKKVQPGNYRLVVSFTGLKSQEKAVEISANTVTTADFLLEISNSELSEVRVTGNSYTTVATRPSASLRIDAPLIEIPQNITVTDKLTIQNIGALSLSDILRTSSGVIASGEKQDISFNIRGTQVITNILRNGVGSGYWYNQDVDAAMIERVEFVKGPAGFMISNSDPGGLINVVTKQPTHSPTARAEFGGGSFKMLRTAVDLGGELTSNHKLTYRLNAGLQKQADYFEFNKFNKKFAALAVKYELSPRTFVTAEYNHVDSRQLSDGHILPTINGDFFVLPYSFGTIDPNVPGPKARDDYYRLQFSHQLSDRWRINAQTAAVNGYWGGVMMGTENISAGYDTLYRYMVQNDWRNKLRTAQAFIDGSVNTGRHISHKLMGGLEYSNLTLRSTGANTYGDHSRFYLLVNEPAYGIPIDSLDQINQNVFDERYSNRYAALYLQDHIKFFNKVILTLAGRYTHSVTYTNYTDPEEITVKKLVPRLGLTYLFNDQFSAYTIYDGAFVPQSGRGFNGGTFKPLTGLNREVGLKGRFFNRFNASVAVYHISRKNALTIDPENPDFQVQSGELTNRGVEFDVSGNVLPNLNMFANYAYIDARISQDNNPALVGLINTGAVKHTANFFCRYEFAIGKIKGFALGAGVAYASPVSGGLNVNTNTFSGYLPSRVIFESTMGYAMRKFSVNLNAYNLLNKRYATSGYRLAGNDWMYAPGIPRNFRLAVAINF